MSDMDTLYSNPFISKYIKYLKKQHITKDEDIT